MFNEKKMEYSRKRGAEIPVIQGDKYKESKQKALEIIDKYEEVGEGDFWILMNETKTGKMMYSGLIISHNGCLKLNDTLESKFDPDCVTVDKEGYKESLVFTYCNKEQGVYEVGEVSSENCKNAYPYAMGFKRLFDRVVLKLTKLAYAGIYSDSEAEEFERPQEDYAQKNSKKSAPEEDFDPDQVIDEKTAKKLESLIEATGNKVKEVTDFYHVDNLTDLTGGEYRDAVLRMQPKSKSVIEVK